MGWNEMSWMCCDLNMSGKVEQGRDRAGNDISAQPAAAEIHVESAER